MPPCILNVDDDAGARHFKTQLLQSAGYSVVEAATGPEALTVLRQSDAALVLLDVRLPGLDGFEVCRQIKTQPSTQTTPVILISAARVTDADWAMGLESGADTYLIVPVAEDVLLGTVRTLLRRSAEAHAWRAEQDRVLEALRASERRHRELFLFAPLGIYTVTKAGRVLTANRAFAEMLGYEQPEALVGVDALSFYEHPPDREALLQRWQQAGRLDPQEARWRTRDDRELAVRLTGRLLSDETARVSEVFEVFVEDVTEQRRMEAERRQSQKMEAIGRLAAGIAHDFNNLLTAIVGYTELLLEQIDADKPIHHDLQQVLQAAYTAAGLTKQLLAFGRKQTFRLEPVAVDAVIRAVEQLLRRVIGETVAIRIEASENLRAIRADRLQLEQVLLNLAVNARDAMSNGGTLTIRADNVDLVERYPFPKTVRVRPGPYVRVVVADTGDGMDAATLEQLFEPFFTTKELGRGTGLGLATVYGIVKQLDGYIWVSSEPGQGSTFSLYFPASEDAAAVAGATDGAGDPIDIGRETILVVEDDAAVRALAGSVLTRHGYRVIEAASPAEAIEAIGNAARPIRLILTDVVMPGMTGPAMMRVIQQTHAIPAVYISGYAGEESAREILDGGDVFLAKPFRQTDLLKAVRRRLDAAPPPPQG